VNLLAAATLMIFDELDTIVGRTGQTGVPWIPEELINRLYR
jgi:hypothetical protein